MPGVLSKNTSHNIVADGTITCALLCQVYQVIISKTKKQIKHCKSPTYFGGATAKICNAVTALLEGLQ